MEAATPPEGVYVFGNGVRVWRRHLLDVQVNRYQADGNSNRYEPEEEAWFETLLAEVRPDPRIWDIGAGIGYYVLLALRHRPDARILAAEPLAEHMDCLRENLALNDIAADRVGCMDQAVYDRDGMLEFEVLDYSSHVIDLPTPALRGDRVAVGTRDIAGMLDAEDGPVDLVKLDVQGSETVILDRILEAGKHDRVRHWIVGTHGAERHAACLDTLSAHYRILHQDPAPAFQMDGLIVAASA